MSSYKRKLIEHLLPAVWDPTYAYGMSNPTAPDPEMPRSKNDPAEGGALYAHLADIKTAWAKTDIPLEEAQALLLRFGFDWSQAEIGLFQGVTHQAVSLRITRGLGRLGAFLNGDSFDESKTEDPSID